MRQVTSVCRICAGACGLVLDLNQDGRIVSARGDKKHPMSAGYACIKGLQAAEAEDKKIRILEPLKRMDDGSFVPIKLETALDEIAAHLDKIVTEHGPDAAGLFKGTQSYLNSTASEMLNSWMSALGSNSFYSTMTIDQSSRLVTPSRMGYWDAGKHRMDDANVMLLLATNPLVSISTPGFSLSNVAKKLKAAKARGMKLIVIDPRRTETATQADIHLSPFPGEDSTILASMLRLILEEKLEDREFCETHVAQLDELKQAIEPYSLEYAAKRSGVDPEQLRDAARLFALGPRGIATLGTGATMATRSNLTDHLLECLNVLCGRMLREGEALPNPGVLTPKRAFRAQVVPPDRHWERGPRHRFGDYGMLAGEKLTGLLADEILVAGEGQLHSLIVAGGNPAVCLPDQVKAVEALKSLDLLIAIEPYMTPTARLSHYVLPPKLQHERSDIVYGPALEQALLSVPFGQYVPPVVEPPQGSEVVDDWYVFWALAKRLDFVLNFAGAELDMDNPPNNDELLALILRDAQVPFEDLKQHARGKVFDLVQCVEPPVPDSDVRFEVAPQDIVAELAELKFDTEIGKDGFTHRLATRRMREFMNTLGQNFGRSKARRPYNPAFMHSNDMQALGVAEGDQVRIKSEHGSLVAYAERDDTMRQGVVAVSHCWGALPDDELTYEEVGVSVNALTSTTTNLQRINAMPRLSAIPVSMSSVNDGIRSADGG